MIPIHRAALLVAAPVLGFALASCLPPVESAPLLSSGCDDPARDTVPQRPRPGDWVSSGAAGPHTEYDYNPRPEDRTAARVGLVWNVLRRSLREKGRLPATLEEEFGDMRIGVDPYHDGWGHELRYTPRGDRFELRAAGPDGCFGTGDDLIATETEALPRPPR
jgi:hypothetical protein